MAFARGSSLSFCLISSSSSRRSCFYLLAARYFCRVNHHRAFFSIHSVRNGLEPDAVSTTLIVSSPISPSLEGLDSFKLCNPLSDSVRLLPCTCTSLASAHCILRPHRHCLKSKGPICSVGVLFEPSISVSDRIRLSIIFFIPVPCNPTIRLEKLPGLKPPTLFQPGSIVGLAPAFHDIDLPHHNHRRNYWPFRT